MNPSKRIDRRQVLKRLGSTLVGLLGVGASAGFAAGRQSNVFAAFSLKHKEPTRVPAGHYDEPSQLYLRTDSDSPMFVGKRLEGHDSYLDEQALDELAERLEPRLLPGAPLADGWCTMSEEVTYSTTTCCPIVTDSSRDRGCDDTTPNPPS